MKLFAQIGHGVGDKFVKGLDEALLDGGIFSPKDLQKSSLGSKIEEARVVSPDAELLIDPQFYVSLFADAPNSKPGNLTEWNYFSAYRKGQLERTKTVHKILRECFQEIAEMPVTGIIAPSVFVSQSLDSREAVIAKTFLREAREVYAELGDDRPLYASLVICREALQDRREFEEFINDITMIESPPDGVYLVIASRSTEARSDYFHTDVLANWMMLNLSLSINGMLVINGYSDILTPFLGVAGGTAGATGWWSNLRMFSMDRFFHTVGGGRQPIPRYLSRLLLNRITFAEKDAIAPYVPSVINGLPHDADYNPEPDRTGEILQSWEALRSLIDGVVTDDIASGMLNCQSAISRAEQAYADIATTGITLDTKSRDSHLEPLEEALRQFKERAQL